MEDDIFAPFEPEPSPRLAALDGLTRVIRIGSFSKTLSASIRCGYVVAKADWIEALIDLQVATSFGGVGPVAAELVAGVLGDGQYRKHLDALRRRLDRARREAADRLVPLGIRPWLMPRGGFYLWCSLPEGRDAADVARPRSARAWCWRGRRVQRLAHGGIAHALQRGADGGCAGDAVLERALAVADQEP